jgi:hypothetical protein
MELVSFLVCPIKLLPLAVFRLRLEFQNQKLVIMCACLYDHRLYLLLCVLYWINSVPPHPRYFDVKLSCFAYACFW